MFVDASAIVAIILAEPDGARLAHALHHSSAPITSPLAIYEAVLAVRRVTKSTPTEAAADVTEFLRGFRIRVMSITSEMGEVALAAHARYGKGQGHPAQLNMGDCFAYAVAKDHRTSLLYKGNDFSLTDIEAA